MLKSYLSEEEKRIEEELGDFLFSVISYSKYLDINPIDALERSNQKFINRFSLMENDILKDDKKIQDLDIKQFEKYWENVKNKGA